MRGRFVPCLGEGCNSLHLLHHWYAHLLTSLPFSSRLPLAFPRRLTASLNSVIKSRTPRSVQASALPESPRSSTLLLLRSVRGRGHQGSETLHGRDCRYLRCVRCHRRPFDTTGTVRYGRYASSTASGLTRKAVDADACDEVDLAAFRAELALFLEKYMDERTAEKAKPKGPKKAPVGFIKFSVENREAVKTALGETSEAVVTGDIAKELGRRWKNLPEEERQVYLKAGVVVEGSEGAAAAGTGEGEGGEAASPKVSTDAVPGGDDDTVAAA